jgi:hypothetical protein
MMEDKETVINNIIKSNENLDSEFYLIPIKLSIFIITNLLYYVTNPVIMRIRSSQSLSQLK